MNKNITPAGLLYKAVSAMAANPRSITAGGKNFSITDWKNMCKDHKMWYLPYIGDIKITFTFEDGSTINFNLKNCKP